MDSVNSRSSYPEGNIPRDTPRADRSPAAEHATSQPPAIAGQRHLLAGAELVERAGPTVAGALPAGAGRLPPAARAGVAIGGDRATARGRTNGAPRVAFQPVMNARAAAPAAPPAPDPRRRAPDERDGFGAPGGDAPVAVAAARRRAAPADVVPDQVIYGRHIQRGDPLRTLLVDGRLVQFTPTEYRLVMTLLERGGIPVPYARLSEAALGRDLDRDARRLLDKHVDHIRAKLRVVSLTVGCIARYGYVLIPDELIED